MLDELPALGETAKTVIFGPVFGLRHVDTVGQAIALINRRADGNMACLFTSSGAAARSKPSHLQVPPLHIGNAPCSWGSLEFAGLPERQIGYEQMLDELVETGYTGTELGDWAYMPTDPAALREELESRRLTMVGAYVPVAFVDEDAHAPGAEHALKVARLLASVADVGEKGRQPYLVLADDNGTDPERRAHAGRATPDLMLDDASWRTFARGVSRIAERVLGETGIPTVFHPHCAGYVETPAEIRQLVDRTDADLVGLVLDTGHYAFGSADCTSVPAGLRTFADRIRHVHFKDCSASVAARSRREGWDYFTSLRHGIFCELGEGCVDFPAVVAELEKMGYEGWVVVEQDVLPGMGSPRESALRNRSYLRGIGL